MSELMQLESPDGTEVFQLKTFQYQRESEARVFTDSLAATANTIIGTDFNVVTRKITLGVYIKNIDPADYPNSSQYTNHAKGFEMEIHRALNDWGLDLFNIGTATLTGPLGFEYDGILTNVSTSINRQSDGASQYQLNLEYTELDITTN